IKTIQNKKTPETIRGFLFGDLTLRLLARQPQHEENDTDDQGDTADDPEYVPSDNKGNYTYGPENGCHLEVLVHSLSRSSGLHFIALFFRFDVRFYQFLRLLAEFLAFGFRHLLIRLHRFFFHRRGSNGCALCPCQWRWCCQVCGGKHGIRVEP